MRLLPWQLRILLLSPISLAQLFLSLEAQKFFGNLLTMAMSAQIRLSVPV
jgi:hypothetical protein